MQTDKELDNLMDRLDKGVANKPDVVATNTPVPQKESNDSWIKNRWRPALAWQYLLVCMFDFVAAPIYYEGAWQILTLSDGFGTYHIAMAALLGANGVTRGFEKMRGMA